MLTEEQKKMVEDNHSLILAYLNNKKNLSFEDYYDVLAIRLCYAAKNYRPNPECTFATYVFKAFDNAVRNEHRIVSCLKRQVDSNRLSLDQNISSHKGEISEVTLLDCIPDSYNEVEDVCLKISVEQFLETLKPSYRHLLELRLEGWTYRQIADKLGCAYQNVSTKLACIARKAKEFGL